MLKRQHWTCFYIPYSQKYWQSLNLAVLPETDRKKILAEFKFGSGVSGPFIKEHCCLSLEVLEQSNELAKYRTGSVLALS